MRARYVNEFIEGSPVEGCFALKAKELRLARSGQSFLSLELADRTGSMPAVYFRPTAEALSIPVGAVVRVTGTVTVYRRVKRVSIEMLAAAEQWDPADLLAETVRPAEELNEEFRRLASSVSEPALRRLLRGVFGERSFFERFSVCPASVAEHHACLRGLIEHTLAVARICEALPQRHCGVDGDLLMAAALLHDIGRVDEIEFDSAISSTDRGRLLGHEVLGVQRIAAMAGRCGTPEWMVLRLEHATLAHHRRLGADGAPATLEALALQHADELDTVTSGFGDAVTGVTRVEERWTDASNPFGRPLYAPGRSVGVSGPAAVGRLSA